jgi:hypothetical protein
LRNSIPFLRIVGSGGIKRDKFGDEHGNELACENESHNTPHNRAECDECQDTKGVLTAWRKSEGMTPPLPVVVGSGVNVYNAVLQKIQCGSSADVLTFSGRSIRSNVLPGNLFLRGDLQHWIRNTFELCVDYRA